MNATPVYAKTWGSATEYGVQYNFTYYDSVDLSAKVFSCIFSTKAFVDIIRGYQIITDE